MRTLLPRTLTAAAVAAAALLVPAAPAFAEPPSRGAPLSDVLPAGVVGLVAALVLAAVCVGHRQGRFKLLSWLGAVSERSTGLPGWAGVPTVVATGRRSLERRCSRGTR